MDVIIKVTNIYFLSLQVTDGVRCARPWKIPQDSWVQILLICDYTLSRPKKAGLHIRRRRKPLYSKA